MSKFSLQFEFDFEFELIAISSSLRDYRICWQINKASQIELVRQPDLEVTDSKKRRLNYFSSFHYEDELNSVHYYLLGNKSSGSFLIPELKRVDYFMLLRGDESGLVKSEILHQLKELSNVEAVFETNPKELKSKHNLILE